MIELTPSARQRLSDYLIELRLALAECGSVDPNEVERDVQDHIQAALGEAAAPVDVPLLDQVLRSLGAPAEWVAEDRAPWFRRLPREWLAEVRRAATSAARRLAVGPESYRLPYLAFLTPVVGWSLFALAAGDGTLAVAVIGTLAGFVFARASLAVHGELGPSPAQRWLLSPSLLLVYVPILLAALAWPIAAGLAALDRQRDQAVRTQIYAQQQQRQERFDSQRATVARLQAEMGKRLREKPANASDPAIHQLEAELDAAKMRLAEIQRFRGYSVHTPGGWEPAAAGIAAGTGVGTGLWWLMLGQWVWWRPTLVRNVFRPFADRYRGRSGLFLSLAGMVVLGASLLLFV